MEKNIKIFIDESGDTSINTKGYYILTAIIIPQSKYDETLKKIENNLRKVPILKSTNIGSNNKRRLEILEKIFQQDVDFKYQSIIVNKETLYKDSAYRFKQIFYKNLHFKLCQKLNLDFDAKVSLYLDEYGSPEFQKSFNEYIKNKIDSLFSNVEFIDDRNNRFIQIADFISGTLQYCFDSNRQSEYSKKFRDIIKRKELLLEVFPENYSFSSFKLESDIDDTIKEISMKQAEKFILNYGDSDDDKMKMCSFILGYLRYKKISDDVPVSSQELEEFLKQYYVSVPNIRKDLIPILRDNGVLLSGNSEGYRIITSAQHIDDYINHNESVIITMLKRLRIAKDILITKSQGEIDVLKGSKLNDLLSAMIESNLEKEKQ